VVADNGTEPDVDVVVIGAGFAGLYMLHRLRGAGFTTTVLEAADDIGGTWYWNRYPGARCDIQSVDYSYSFDPELDDEWEWSEKYATQPEILRYMHHVADKHDLKRDIRFDARVESAVWDDDAATWTIRTEGGDQLTCRHYVMATGCLSMPKSPDIEGVERFTGDVHYTSRWPHERVDFTGKRVGVIGTGSSGIQSIPIIARQAEQLTVFQRTPNFSFPAHNGPVPEDKRAQLRERRDDYREEARWSGIGVPAERPEEGAFQIDDEERERRYEHVWERGELVAIGGAVNDLLVNPAANETMAEFVRGKIRSIVDDPATADLLCPTDHPLATKRPCLDTGYYETFNLPHVRLVDLRTTPIASITETGIDTTGPSGGESFEFDAIVFATGFDAMTGAIVNVDIAGRDGLQLAEKWAHGPQTYLGLMSRGFPNLFMITGPQSPSVLSNMMVSIEQHVDWITDCLEYLRDRGFKAIEPTETAEAGWVQHVNDYADITLYPQANSWYMGANVPGKPRVFLPYVGGVDRYRQVCIDVVEEGYLGFHRSGDGRAECNDGVVRRAQPDVTLMLEAMAELQLPTMDTMSVDEARAFSVALSAERPPGPDVGEVLDGILPGADGQLRYRLYRPTTPGPHPVVAYFHGGGWVLGSHDSDDPLCRDLCVRADAMIISVDYRHAPEHRFPAAAEDGLAAVTWIADHAEELDGLPGQLAVCGWSAGGNVAAVACQMARDAGVPHISGQVLICPVTDSDFSRPSYEENGEGFILTRSLMDWFWDHYADPEERTDHRVAPLRAADLTGLPPALVATCEFDPLRDEGAAYAEALAAAGVPTRHLACRGQMHTSIPAVDVILSTAPIRADIAAELAKMLRPGAVRV
jgi:cation diffusion facilitator CzcD-associated flavoprotein CzcO/acetyl esterase/lipase